jgi:hypothetical protein
VIAPEDRRYALSASACVSTITRNKSGPTSCTSSPRVAEEIGAAQTISAASWEAINRAVVTSARHEKLDDGGMCGSTAP